MESKHFFELKHEIMEIGNAKLEVHFDYHNGDIASCQVNGHHDYNPNVLKTFDSQVDALEELGKYQNSSWKQGDSLWAEEYWVEENEFTRIAKDDEWEFKNGAFSIWVAKAKH